MSLLIDPRTNKDISFELKDYDNAAKCFILENETVKLRIPNVLQSEDRLREDLNFYAVNIFANKLCGENDIYKVYDSDDQQKIVGWIFPLQSLLSNEHDYAEDPFFLKIAFAAYQKLLMSHDLQNKKPPFNGEPELGLESFYPPEDIILIIKKDEIEDFDIKYYLPVLFKYGYNIKNSGEFKEGGFISKYFDELDTNIKLQRISKYLKGNQYLYDLFESVLDDRNPIHVFIASYQVIEILIFDIFKERLKECMDDYNNLSEEDLDGFWKTKKKLAEIDNDQYRINLLFNRIAGTQELLRLCNILLKKLNIKEKESAGEALYTVRNNLVHSYRLFRKEELALLKDIVEEFIGIIVDLVTSYKK